jgi:RNA polymerase sigma-70 factor (ECF subfamily)
MRGCDTTAETGAPICSSAVVAYAGGMEHTPDDGALMLRYADGDVSAFETLYARHNDALYRYLLRLTYHPPTAEDVFQETWGKVIKARDGYRPTAKFRTWLFRVAHNCFVDHLRRHRRHAGDIEFDPETLSADTDPPELETERALARRRLEAALADIPAEQREAFLLHEEAGLGIDQIAFVTGVDREAAKSRLRYATRKLRAAIEEPRDALEAS